MFILIFCLFVFSILVPQTCIISCGGDGATDPMASKVRYPIGFESIALQNPETPCQTDQDCPHGFRCDLQGSNTCIECGLEGDTCQFSSDCCSNNQFEDLPACLLPDNGDPATCRCYLDRDCPDPSNQYCEQAGQQYTCEP